MDAMDNDAPSLLYVISMKFVIDSKYDMNE
jgi:hypothetical protein